MIDGEEMLALVNDIKANGLHVPISVWREHVIDGRNRQHACGIAGVAPRFRELRLDSEADAVRYVISVNLRRRHLTTSQRAMIAAGLANLRQGGDAGEPNRSNELLADAPAIGQATAAKLMGVSVSSLKRAKAAKEGRERHRPQTDPDRAADDIVDATEARNAEGDTPRARAFLAAAAKLDDTERTFLRADVRKVFGL